MILYPRRHRQTEHPVERYGNFISRVGGAQQRLAACIILFVGWLGGNWGISCTEREREASHLELLHSVNYSVGCFFETQQNSPKLNRNRAQKRKRKRKVRAKRKRISLF